jgi:hypothetical protein
MKLSPPRFAWSSPQLSHTHDTATPHLFGTFRPRDGAAVLIHIVTYLFCYTRGGEYQPQPVLRKNVKERDTLITHHYCYHNYDIMLRKN